MPVDRYHRQILLPGVGPAGQRRLGAASVMIVGIGALGGVLAEQLCRAGVGRLTLIDRDIVEETNLQRQVLFDESHARAATPKAVAAAERLGAINSGVALVPVIADFDSENAARLFEDATPDLVLDGCDNAETRYLINDLCVQRGVPWVYGACVGTAGRVMPVLPGRGPCLRCVFETPPGAGELETCDTAGVLGPAAGVVASLQAALALRLLIEGAGGVPIQLTSLDVWTGWIRVTDVSDGRRANCPCCGLHAFAYLDAAGRPPARLCGRAAVQLRMAKPDSFAPLQTRLAPAGDVGVSDYALSFKAHTGESLTLFTDGRLLVHGTDDPARARSIVARFLGG